MNTACLAGKAGPLCLIKLTSGPVPEESEPGIPLRCQAAPLGAPSLLDGHCGVLAATVAGTPVACALCPPGSWPSPCQRHILTSRARRGAFAMPTSQGAEAPSWRGACRSCECSRHDSSPDCHPLGGSVPLAARFPRLGKSRGQQGGAVLGGGRRGEVSGAVRVGG